MNARESLRITLISKYQRMIDTEENCDIEPWTCKVCGWGPVGRLFASVEHCLAHLRRNELEPMPRSRPEPKEETVTVGVRPIELE